VEEAGSKRWGSSGAPVSSIRISQRIGEVLTVAAASSGLTIAQSALCSPDDAEGVAWCQKASENGNAHAEAELGYAYSTGMGGLPTDASKAFSFAHKSAQAGDEFGQSNLGVYYPDGFGVQEDDSQAEYWLRKAAEQGNHNAQELLAGLPAIRQRRQNNNLQRGNAETLACPSQGRRI
jgi:TPR repeat protein